MATKTPIKKPAPRKTRKGRPTAEESQELEERIKSSALENFLEHGFDAATMDNIAMDAGVTKRTLYARYTDKEALFQQVFTWALVEWREVNLDLELEGDPSLEEELVHAASLLLRRELNIKVVKLGRIASSQIDRLPDYLPRNASMAWSPRMKGVINILQRHVDQGEIIVDDPELTAELFISLIIGIPTRLAAFGIFRDDDYEQRRIKEAVRLFVQGLRSPKRRSSVSRS